MPALKIIYFDTTGRAEAARLALTIGDVPFEDVRVNREQVAEMKSSGKLPMGSLPSIEVDGKVVSQSAAIMNYAGKLGGLYPSDPFDGMKVEEVRGCLEDIWQMVYGTVAIQDLDEKIAKRKELIDGKMGEKIAALDKLLGSNGKKCAVSDEITIADLDIYTTCSRGMMTSGFLDGVPTDLFDKHANISAICKMVAEHPKVANWNADHAKE